MALQIKFCGLTRPDDVAEAEALGAAYVGAIFAGGPRLQTPESARTLFASVRQARRVGVFGADSLEAIRAVAAHVPLDVVQLHGDPMAGDIARLRAVRDVAAREHPASEHATGERAVASADRRSYLCEVWAVLRIAGDAVPSNAPALFREADAVVLDTRSTRGLGGTGATFLWDAVAAHIAPYRGETRVFVAGGLTPANVAEAVRALRPAGVDVSSGVEQAPGVKDRLLMRQFAEAARAAYGE
jgi:phosphoribosylanthranilate isomerase